MGNAKLASFCVQHAAFMNEGMSENQPNKATQQTEQTVQSQPSASRSRKGATSASEKTNAVSIASQSVTQRAVVFAFLKNFSKAIAILEHELRIKPNPEIFNLLGRVFMKAKKLNEAVESFEESVDCILEVFRA